MLKGLCLHCCLLTAAVAADSEYSQCENTMQSLGNSPLTVMHNRCYSAVAVCLSWEGIRMLVQCMYASKPNLACIANDSWHCFGQPCIATSSPFLCLAFVCFWGRDVDIDCKQTPRDTLGVLPLSRCKAALCCWQYKMCQWSSLFHVLWANRHVA